MSFDAAAVEVVVFDTFGTVADWRGSIAREIEALAAKKHWRGIDADAFARSWRRRYQPAMQAVRAGERPWTTLDVLHRENLDEVLDEFGLASRLSEAEKDELNLAWHRLEVWPDAVPGLERLKRRYIVGTFSNGGMLLLTRMAKHAGLPWDVITCSDVFHAYKADPKTYLGIKDLLGGGVDGRVMLAAAHNGDLAHARAHGLATAFIARPYEYGPDQTKDFGAEQDWDVIVESIEDLAARMGT